jgi:hypothetical protein
VYDGTQGTATLYVNGAIETVQSGLGNSLGSNHACDLTIGYLPQGPPDAGTDPNAFFAGWIDEVAVWNRALGAAEISALYHAAGPL